MELEDQRKVEGVPGTCWYCGEKAGDEASICQRCKWDPKRRAEDAAERETE